MTTQLSPIGWRSCALVAVVGEGERKKRMSVGGGGVTGCSEVTTTWREVWSPSEPRKAPAEGPPSANKRGSGRTLRHSQGRPPGDGRRNLKLARAVAGTINK